MAKQKTTQQFVFKINSTLLAKNNWDLSLPLERARRVPGLVVSLADSQILTWINELNGTVNIDNEAKEIKSQIKYIKKQPTSSENKSKIKQLYTALYKLQFKEDYVCVIMDKKSHYDRCNHGFKINGVPYKRLLCTTNGVKTSTVVYVSEKLLPELKKRINNGRNEEVPLVPAKLGAYEALAASASVEVSWPKGVIVVSDCIVHFKSDLINIDDSDITQEPMVQFVANAEVENNCSDGCGMMLPSLSMRWSGELDGHPERTLSGCNLRNAFTKGMAFTFDFIKFAEEVAGSYIIKDVWGYERDIRDAELILTESQLKLWACYDSWEDYYNNCIENHYTFRVAKTSPYFEEMDDIRQLNYQFIQPLNLSDDDIKQLIAPTVDEINDILGFDYKKSIVYMCGKGLDENTVKYVDPICKALMIDKSIINDQYLRNRIHKMIEKRIKDAKIGVLDVHGNFQILSGDLYALCEHIFGLEPHGLLKKGEIYSKYWINCGASKVFCARAPMSNEHSLVSQELNYAKNVAEWFKYMDSVVVVNAWDTMPQALNGFDFDGDLLFTTDNEVLLRNQNNLPALNCIQYKAKKSIITEDLLVDSNKKGFGSKIGQITNRITEMTSLMASFLPESEEYKILKYRTQCGQAQQQAEIDAAKGIIPNPMPKSWYIWSENIIKEDDSDDIIAKKKLYQNICAHKKPYFFQYNYSSLRAEYLAHKKQANENCISLFNKTLDELLCSDSLSQDEERFIYTYKNKMKLDFSPSTMNRICWEVEKIFDKINWPESNEFDYSILKSNVEYSLQDYASIKKLCKNYQSDCKLALKNQKKNKDTDSEEIVDVDQLIILLEQNINGVVPNKETQCDILIDLCYRDGINKQVVWTICGDIIVDNLLKRNNNIIRYPKKCENGDFWCCGNQFSMETLVYGGENDEEL